MTPEQDRQLQIVRSSATHLLSLINDALDLAKIESGKRDLNFEPVSVAEVIEEVTAAQASLATEKGLEFSSSVDGVPETIVTDRRSLAQILLNLTSNALKYTERGSRPHRRQIERIGRLLIDVSDTGIGIRPRGSGAPFQGLRTTRSDEHAAI